MRPVAALLVVIALVGCGGDSPEDALRDEVREQTERVRERVQEAGKRARESDKALLEIDKTDLPDDVKKELLDAQELLDKYDK